VLVVSTAMVVAAQSVEFEVATIKPNKTGDPGMMVGTPGPGRYMAENVTLNWLIQHAWNVLDFQIEGLQGPMASRRFDIQATMTPGASNEAIQKMLQALIVDRFGMKVHRQSREMSSYALMAARNGFKVKALAPGACVELKPGERPPEADPEKPQTPSCGGAGWGPGSIRINGVSMDRFASLLGDVLKRIVVNKTDAEGLFDLSVKWVPDDALNAADGPSVFTALQEQLGLRLESTKTPVEMLVIDEVHLPSEN
jgi:uncharacterized protein (TIGR03435 family)